MMSLLWWLLKGDHIDRATCSRRSTHGEGRLSVLIELCGSNSSCQGYRNGKSVGSDARGNSGDLGLA